MPVAFLLRVVVFVPFIEESSHANGRQTLQFVEICMSFETQLGNSFNEKNKDRALALTNLSNFSGKGPIPPGNKPEWAFLAEAC